MTAAVMWQVMNSFIHVLCVVFDRHTYLFCTIPSISSQLCCWMWYARQINDSFLKSLRKCYCFVIMWNKFVWTDGLRQKVFLMIKNGGSSLHLEKRHSVIFQPSSGNSKSNEKRTENRICSGKRNGLKFISLRYVK